MYRQAGRNERFCLCKGVLWHSIIIFEQLGWAARLGCSVISERAGLHVCVYTIETGSVIIWMVVLHNGMEMLLIFSGFVWIRGDAGSVKLGFMAVAFSVRTTYVTVMSPS